MSRHLQEDSDADIVAAKAADPFWFVAEFCDELSAQFSVLRFGTLINSLISTSRQSRGKDEWSADATTPASLKKWPFKVYSLNCSQQGYQLCFHLYRGKAGGDFLVSLSCPYSSSWSKIPSSQSHPLHRKLIYQLWTYSNLLAKGQWMCSIARLEASKAITHS